MEISIHAPRGGSDPEVSFITIFFAIFQSTLPVGGATSVSFRTESLSVISIHAPRGGSDLQGRDRFGNLVNFNPRSPWGERPV